MKILKITFTNLNSLAGTWTIDFENPEFQSDGLFLIAGPTGAGKTTLLDAICLGLFGETPRLSSEMRTRPSSSQNEIMTRQTGFCSAEVTFETSAGRFRSLWMQQRANRAPGGKLRPPRHELALDSGKILCDQSSETKSMVQQYLGLDFDQFKRAVLLAQNQFNSFLNADDQKKSEILEKLTDTSIYTDLSRLAYEKARNEAEKLKNLQERCNDFSVPTPEKIEEEKKHLQDIVEKIEHANQSIESATRLLQRLERLEQLRLTRQKLFRDRQALESDLRAFQPELQRLERAREARTMEDLYLRLESQREQMKKTRQDLLQHTASLQQKNLALELAQSKYETESALAKKESDDLEAARPILEQARLLDATIGEKEREFARLQATARDCMRRREESASYAQELATSLGRLNTQAEANAEWLREHAADEWLEQNFMAFKTRSVQIASLRDGIAQLERQLTADISEIGKIDKSIEDEEKKLKSCLDKKNTHEAMIEGLNARKNKLLAGCTLDALIDMQKERMILAERYKSLEEHRKLLQANEPCPLCGSRSHPWAADCGPDIEAMTAASEELLKRIRGVEEADKEAAHTEKARNMAINEITGLTASIRGLDDQRARQSAMVEKERHQIHSARIELSTMENSLLEELRPLQLQPDLDIAQIEPLLIQRLNDLAGMKKKRDKLRLEIHSAEMACAAANENQAHASQAANAANQELEGIRARLDQDKQKRRALLPGISADEEEKRMQERVARANSILEGARKNLEETRKETDIAKGHIAMLEEKLAQLAPDIQKSESRFRRELAGRGINEATFLDMRLDEASRQVLENKMKSLEARQNRLAALEDENRKSLENEKIPDSTDRNSASVRIELEEMKKNQKILHEERAETSQRLKSFENNKQELLNLQKALDSQKNEAIRWDKLNRKIGSSDGKKFRSFAQSITLDRLLCHANRQLADINPRYALIRANRQGNETRNLDLEVIDYYQAGEIRSIRNLSGGESFMASLALALGLSEMAGKTAPLGSLFLDEGFGTLDNDALDTAFAAIGKLKQAGKLIGIISHVEALKDWIPTRIHVSPRPDDPARSQIYGPGCSGSATTQRHSK